MNILVAGDVSVFADSLCAMVSRNHRLVLADPDIPAGKYAGNVSVFRNLAREALFPHLFSSFDFDAAVYILHQGEPRGENISGSLENLKALLSLCAKFDVRRFVLVSSTEACGVQRKEETAPAEPASSAGMIYAAGEEMGLLYGAQPGHETLILRLPRLYGVNREGLLLWDMLSQAALHKPVALPGRADQLCEFVHVEDAASLLVRMVEDASDPEKQTVHACDKAVKFSDLSAWIRNQFPGCKIKFEADPGSVTAPAAGENARKQYDWLALHDLKHDFSDAAAALKKGAVMRCAVLRRIRSVLQRNSWMMQLVEVGAGFALIQFLVSATGESLQFRFIDFRLLFVVIMGSVHGARIGALAALLACVSYIMGYFSMNLDWRALVYNVDNWLPYVSYLLVGIVTGHIRDRNGNAAAFQKRRIGSLEKRYDFLYGLYHKTLEVKARYKDQLISYENSYGKVYEASRRLDHLIPDAVLLEAVRVLEENFGNSSIAIYSVQAAGSFARLEACSPPLSGAAGKSIAAAECPDLCEKLLGGQIWVNRDMRENDPFYCMPLYCNDALTFAAAAFHVPYELKSASGANQFTVLCKLVQSALNRALAYRSATEFLGCVAGTHILPRDRFHEFLNIRWGMQGKGYSCHALLRIVEPGGDLSALCRKVERGIRRNDRIGQGMDDNLYILLRQAIPGSEKQIIDRLASLGIRCVPAEFSNDGINIRKESSDVA